MKRYIAFSVCLIASCCLALGIYATYEVFVNSENVGLWAVVMVFVATVVNFVVEVVGHSISVAVLRRQRASSALHKRPPGRLLVLFGTFFYPDRVYNDIFAQVIEDMREEHFRALNAGRCYRATWMEVWYHVAFVGTMIAYFMTAIGKRFSQLSKLVK